MKTRNLKPPVRRESVDDSLDAELRRRLETEDPRYPHSDGKPLAESEAHMQCIRWMLDALEDILKGRENVSLHGDLFWYWQKGDPKKCRVPDAMVICGVPMDRNRLSFKSWEHDGAVPSVIIETASDEQESLLLGDIRDDYERQGVKEYFVFDWSDNEYLSRKLYGFRLRGRKYQSVRPSADGSMLSQQLNVKMRPERRMLRFVDAESNEPIKTRSEQISALRVLLQQAGLDPDAAK